MPEVQREHRRSSFFFTDRENFGRTEMHLSSMEVYSIRNRSIRKILSDIVKRNGARLHHVKPHGALYNMAAKDPVLLSESHCAGRKRYRWLSCLLWVIRVL